MIRISLGEMRRQLDFAIQNRLTWSAPVLGKGVPLPASLWQNWSEAAQQRYRTLQERYDLDPWAKCCRQREWWLSLYALDVLDRYLPSVSEQGQALDVGASDWSYLPGLASWRKIPWDGIEINGHRRYVTMVTARGYGHWMAQHFPDCHYQVGSLLDIKRSYALITWFLPYLFRETVTANRLPGHLLMPETLLQHAWTHLDPGGTLWIVNQGEEEASLQQQLLGRWAIPFESIGPIESHFSPYQRPRYGFRVFRPRD